MLTIPASRVDVPRHQSWQHPTLFLLKAFIILIFALLFGASLLKAKPVEAAPHTVTWPPIPLVTVESGFDKPIDLVSPNDGTDRLFVVERGGVIYIIENGERVTTPFLDISDRTSDISGGCNECGLLGLAFPPDFAENGYFFVNYTSAVDLIGPDTGDPDPSGMGDTVIARFFVTGNPNVADPDSEDPILLVNQPDINHNGGHILFGPDDYLYIGMGDGGGGGDDYENAQNPESLHGKLLRIEVGATGTYTIPDDNPFIDTEPYRDEIWMEGLRNPWRFNFDRATGDLYIADVGQGTYEEINYVAAADIGDGGLNFGWPIMEGNFCFPPSGSQSCNRTGLTEPVVTYNHSLGNCSVTGGYVYDSEPPIYLYGDYCTGRVWGLQPDGASWATSELNNFDFQITSFGEDENNDVYIVSYAGTIYQINNTITGLTATNSSPTKLHSATTFNAAVTAGTNISYSWSFGDGSNDNGISPSHTYTQSGVYTATVVASNETNAMTATTTVYIGDAVVNVTSNQYTPRNATIPPGGTVIWKLVNGTHSVTADDASFEQPAGTDWPPFVHTFTSVAAADDTTVAYHCTVHAGLGMTGTFTILEGPPPVGGLSAENDGPKETNEPVDFTATITGGTEITYTWDFGDGNSGTSITTTHAYTPGGIYTATVVATNATNSMTATTAVYIGDAVVDVTSNLYTPKDVTIPEGGTMVWVRREGSHSVTEVNGRFNQPENGSWSTFVQTFGEADEYPYYCTAHGSEGGAGMAGTVTVAAPFPDAIEGLAASNNGPTTVGDSTAFTASVTAGTEITYAWDFGDGNSGNGATPTNNYAEAGIYTATVVASNDTNSMTATTTVYIGDTIVEVSSNQYTPSDFTIVAGDIVIWELVEGEHSVTADDGSFNQPLGSNWPPFVQTFTSVAATNDTTVSYHCTLHADLGMTGDITILAEQPPVAGLNAENDGPKEVNEPVGFTATITGGTEISYSWDFGDGNNGSGITTTHSYTEAGIYTATVTASNDTNTMSATTTVYVGDVVVEVTSDLFTPRHITVPVGSSVVWVRRQGIHSVTEDDNRFEQPASDEWSTFVQTFDQADLYPYHCVIHGFAGGQLMAGSVNVTDQGPPPPAIEGLTAANDGPTVVGDPIAFTASITAGTAISYSWNFGDGNNGGGITTTHTYAEAGIYTATVMATNATNSMTATTTIYVGDAIVDVQDNFYAPRNITVPVGSTVIWVLREGFHSVTEDTNRFDQPAGEDWPPFVQTFNSADTYPYYCTVHGNVGGIDMAGRVTVGENSQEDEVLLLPNIRNNQIQDNGQ